MDLSKLPKLSNTSEQVPPPLAGLQNNEPTSAPVQYRTGGTVNPSIGGDIWFSAIIGLLLIAMGFTFAKFLAAKVSRQPFHTGWVWPDDDPRAGQEVAYFDLQGYTAWTDMGIFLFGLVLLFEAAAKAAIVLRPGPVSRGVLRISLIISAAATILNLYVCMLLFRAGTLPVISGLAVAFGGWIIADQIRSLKIQRPIAIV